MSMLKGTSINVPFPRLRRQRRARILMYRICTAVLRAVLPCTHKKLTVFRGSFKSVALIGCSLFSLNALAQESPGLGESMTAEEVAAVDYAVLPNGDGLPDGSGTAEEGATVYQQHCFACHGERGTGGVNDTLAGGHGSMTTDRPQKTVGSFWPYATTVFDYVRRSMPLQSPGTLSNDEMYAVTAYLLFINDVIGENDAINADTLPVVKMPNRENFVWGYSPTE